jgi:hypothetical protein
LEYSEDILDSDQISEENYSENNEVLQGEYTINLDKRGEFVKNATLKQIGMTTLILFFLSIAFLALLMSTHNQMDEDAAIGISFYFVALILGLAAYKAIKNYSVVRAIKYVLTDLNITLFHDPNKMSMFSNLTSFMKENENGLRQVETISYSELEKTNIKTKGITFFRKDFNNINGKGKIFVPSQINKFDEFKMKIETNPKTFKL